MAIRMATQCDNSRKAERDSDPELIDASLDEGHDVAGVSRVFRQVGQQGLQGGDAYLRTVEEAGRNWMRRRITGGVGNFETDSGKRRRVGLGAIRSSGSVMEYSLLASALRIMFVTWRGRSTAMLRQDESRYIENILVDPRNSGPRLAYADWLKEQGDQQCEQYLRLQCQQRHFLGQDEDFWENRQGWGKRRTDESGSANENQRTIGELLRELEKELDSGWLVWVLEDFAVPPDISESGRRAAKTILSVLARNKTAKTGGISLFRSPQWGREGGLIKEHSLAVLIVVYDVWLQTFFEYVPHRTNLQSHEAAMERALRAEGFFAEPDGFGRAYIVDTSTERTNPRA